MVRKIEWTKEGRVSKLEILEYWNNRNKSNVYSIKLNKLISTSLKKINKLPQLGRPTQDPNIKYIPVREYDFFYKEFPDRIHVLLIWDSRRDPISLRFQK